MMVLLLLQMATTWAMTGIIWFVQLVQYPSFARVDANAFSDFHAHHTTAISVIVGPLMIAEAISAVALLWASPRVGPPWSVWLGLGLVVVIWASTFFLQVPAHTKLGTGFDESTWRFLVQSNWIRTIAWSARSALVSYWLYLVIAEQRAGSLY
jgi:hypothetical protein